MGMVASGSRRFHACATISGVGPKHPRKRLSLMKALPPSCLPIIRRPNDKNSSAVASSMMATEAGGGDCCAPFFLLFEELSLLIAELWHCVWNVLFEFRAFVCTWILFFDFRARTVPSNNS
jgi:hypothetical protein